MSQHYALGTAGGAGGVNEPGKIVRAGFRRKRFARRAVAAREPRLNTGDANAVDYLVVEFIQKHHLFEHRQCFACCRMQCVPSCTRGGHKNSCAGVMKDVGG